MLGLLVLFLAVLDFLICLLLLDSSFLWMSDDNACASPWICDISTSIMPMSLLLLVLEMLIWLVASKIKKNLKSNDNYGLIIISSPRFLVFLAASTVFDSIELGGKISISKDFSSSDSGLMFALGTSFVFSTTTFLVVLVVMTLFSIGTKIQSLICMVEKLYLFNIQITVVVNFYVIRRLTILSFRSSCSSRSIEFC